MDLKIIENRSFEDVGETRSGNELLVYKEQSNFAIRWNNEGE